MHLEFESQWFFNPGQPFGDVIARHDAFDFARWRKVFDRHAGKLAALFVEQFANVDEAKRHGAGEVRRVLGMPLRQRCRERRVGFDRVYDPWANWWKGEWGTKREVNYHIWDVTQPFKGAHIQAVTQSTSGFVSEATIGSMASESVLRVRPDAVETRKVKARADLAINVASRKLGLTGWVSKRQGGNVQELPHLGYLLDRGQLLWIACDARDTSRWLMFFERATTSGDILYTIDGVYFKFDESTGDCAVISGPKVHFGRYRYHEPIQASAAP